MEKYLLTEVDYLAKSLPDDIMALHEKHKHLRYLKDITNAAAREIKPDYEIEDLEYLQGWLYMAGHIKSDQEAEAKKQAMIADGWHPLTPEYIEAVYKQGVKKIEVSGTVDNDWMTNTINKKIYKPWHGKSGAFIMSPKARTRGKRVPGVDNLFAREVKQ